MYRVAIIEDEAEQAARLAALVSASSFAEDLALVDASEAGPDLTDVDILLVDIDLGAGTQSGIDWVRALADRGSSAQVVYVSGYPGYASKVYSTQHAGFLLKPLTQDLLDEVLGRVIRQIEGSQSRPVAVTSKDGVVSVVPRDVIYAETKGRRLLLHMRSQVLETYASIAELEKLLPDGFVRCHKSYLVNMEWIERVGRSEIELRGGERVPVSQRRRTATRERFVEYLGRSL